LSRISLSGNASGTGTLTLSAPNTDTDRTLTIPDAAGTIQVSGNPISGTTGSFSGDLSFNSGYGSVATAYGCRAWVNFDGSSNSANLTGTYSQTGTTVTVSITAHGYSTGQSAFLDFTSGTAVDGTYTVTVTDANTFTVTQASRTTSGNVTNRRNPIRASGNVSSITDNGTGDYTVNFTTAMADANYAVETSSIATAANAPRHTQYNTLAVGSVVVYCCDTAGGAADPTSFSVAIFR